MELTRTCPQCRQPLAADAPDGLCPQCLLRAVADPAPTGPSDGSACAIIDIANPAEVGKKLPQFEILEMLGRGGMGVVYKARQLQLDRIIALKILPPGDARSADFVARFTREARALAKLNHPNIVNVHDFGEAGGLYYIVMEYVDGANLRQLLESQKLTAAEALAIVSKICDALQYAHEEGLVHRDIKPENLLIDKRGRVKIADFGLAKLLRREALDMTLTLSGMTVGTVRYMAPEQMESPETVDHRADLYSLGVVIYEMLTGETPVGRFELPSQRAQVDVRLDQIVLHALEREPDRRYQHASEVRDDVEKVTSKPTTEPVSPRAPTAATNPWKSRSVRVTAILGMVTLVIILLSPVVEVNPRGLVMSACAALLVVELLMLGIAGLFIYGAWKVCDLPLKSKLYLTLLSLLFAICSCAFFSGASVIPPSGVSGLTLTIGAPYPWFEALMEKRFRMNIILASWEWAIFALGWLSLATLAKLEEIGLRRAGILGPKSSGHLPARKVSNNSPLPLL